MLNNVSACTCYHFYLQILDACYVGKTINKHYKARENIAHHAGVYLDTKYGGSG
jgi:hypothetical protein